MILDWLGLSDFADIFEVAVVTDLTVKIVSRLNSLRTALFREVSVYEKVSDEEQCASCCPLNAQLATVGTADRNE